jgi:AcrR family transcriptional regulator
VSKRPYTSARRSRSADTVERVLEAAERLMREDAFHVATMDELAAAAGVSRATVFNRFGSKLGVMQALFARVMEGPEMEAIRGALELEDPVAALEAAIEASCGIWESSAFIHEQLQAIVVLEPDASALVDQQRKAQRDDLLTLARRLSRAGRLRPGLSETRAAAALHMLTSLESFLWLRRNYGLSLRQTHETIAELARTLLTS